MTTTHLIITFLVLFTFNSCDGLPFGVQMHVDTQLQAQAICGGIETPRGGWVSAVPRKCVSGSQESCSSVCSRIPNNAKDTQRKSANTHICYNSIHVYSQDYSTHPNFAGLKTYKYNSCAASGCGPNYCCCLSY